MQLSQNKDNKELNKGLKFLLIPIYFNIQVMN